MISEIDLFDFISIARPGLCEVFFNWGVHMRVRVNS